MFPLISVIVPIYNVEPYLVRCIESIINQTYKNLEIILVDDGSPDECGAICNEYALKDNRIKVFHKPNGGLSDARNYGIDRASGEFISFVDSDDFIDIEFFNQLFNAAKLSGADIVECGSIAFYDNCEPKSIITNYGKTIYPKDWLMETNLGSFVSCVVWNKLYKKSLFNEVRFPVGRRYEDEATTYKLVYMSNYVYRLESKLYFYRQRSNSITGSANNVENIKEQYEALFEKYIYFDSLKEDEIADFSLSKLMIFMISKLDFVSPQIYSKWKQFIINNTFSVIRSNSIPLKYKAYIIAFRFGPKLIIRKVIK